MIVQVTTHEEIMELASDYSLLDNEYFFDRHPRSFNTILNFYRTGKLHMNEEMCIISFRDDLSYWGIGIDILEPCCHIKYESLLYTALGEITEVAEFMVQDAPEIFGSGFIGKYQKCLWDLIEHGESSKAAGIVSGISMSFVLISTISMCVNTLPGLKVVDDTGELENNPLLELIETICVIWFSLEYVLRLIGAPYKKLFLQNGLNFVDVLAIMPFFVEVYFNHKKAELLARPTVHPDMVTVAAMTTPVPWATNFTSAFPDDKDDGDISGVLDVFRVLKLARILKLSRWKLYMLDSYHSLNFSVFFVSFLTYPNYYQTFSRPAVNHLHAGPEWSRAGSPRVASQSSSLSQAVSG